MGTTLTGTTPQDTYDSLIKVTDNGPLSGSLKKLTDGLGNDSSLSLSTTAASLSGTLAVSGTSSLASINSTGSINGFAGATQNLLIDYSTSSQVTTLTNTELFFGTNANRRMTITAAGNVGIGTSSPSDKLHVSGAGNTATFITGSGCTTYIQSVSTETRIGNLSTGGGSIVFSPADAERVRVTSNGLTFNGDTAAANALDDYEEGTWTPTYQGGITGVTYSNTQGRYTKIGNAVHWRARVQATAGTAAASQVIIGGFPFTSASAPESAGCVGYFTIYTTDVIYMYNEANTTSIAAFYKKDGNALIGTDLSNVLGVIHMSGTYFV